MSDSGLFRFLVETPVGAVTIVFREKPFTVSKILLPSESAGDKVNISLADKKLIKNTDHPVKIISNLLSVYFSGTSIKPPWKLMSLKAFTPLQKAVLHKTAGIPFGKLKTYRDIAIAIGRPKAYRFVGTTLAKNPYPLLIPCHRVIRSDHQIGEFGGGTALKKQLIVLESQNR